MILVFGLGFVVLGVGSGGLDLGSILQDIGGRGGSSGPSISKLTERVNEHPRDAAARKQLAKAYADKGRIQEALAAYQEYIDLRPRDTEALTTVASLQSQQADTYAQQAQIAQDQQAFASARATFGVPSDSKFGKALGTDPIANVVETRSSSAFQQAYSQYVSAVQATIAAYQKLAKVQPTVENLLTLAQRAARFQDTATAVKAYKQALKATDDPSLKAEIRSTIKTLQPASGKGAGG